MSFWDETDTKKMFSELSFYIIHSFKNHVLKVLKHKFAFIFHKLPSIKKISKTLKDIQEVIELKKQTQNIYLKTYWMKLKALNIKKQ